MTSPAAQIFRDYETDGDSSSGAHKPLKSELRAWGAQYDGDPVDVTVAGSVTVGSSDRVIIINLASPGTVVLSLPAVATRNNLPLEIIDFAGNAAMAIGANGAETIMGQAAWTVAAGGAGMGLAIRLIPSVARSGWAVSA